MHKQDDAFYDEGLKKGSLCANCEVPRVGHLIRINSNGKCPSCGKDVSKIDKNKISIDDLVEAHWNYVKGVLEHAGEINSTISIIEFHYRTAFTHGYKHGVADSK